MSYQLFLSHDHRDEPLAKALAGIITRISSKQLHVWFSSDPSASGGTTPGKIWLDEIRERLKGSRAVLTLLTPQSVERPWLLFESGFGAALPDCEVIPVSVGLSTLSGVPSPLAAYPLFRLTDLDSLKKFIAKLLNQYQIEFDDEMATPVLKGAISMLVSPQGEQLHSVPVNLGLGDSVENDQVVEIRENTSIQDVIDQVYFMLSSQVPAFAYLSKWVLRETSSGLGLIVHDVTHLIPAMTVMRPGTTWHVEHLTSPIVQENRAPNQWYRVRLPDVTKP